MKLTVLKRFMYKNKARIEGDIVDITDDIEANNLIKFEYAKQVDDVKTKKSETK